MSAASILSSRVSYVAAPVHLLQAFEQQRVLGGGRGVVQGGHAPVVATCRAPPSLEKDVRHRDPAASELPRVDRHRARRLHGFALVGCIVDQLQQPPTSRLLRPAVAVTIAIVVVVVVVVVVAGGSYRLQSCRMLRHCSRIGPI